MIATITTIIFLNDLGFWGLLAVVIPIIIHLFNLRRVKRVEFSNTTLLRRIKEESSAKRKPIELLVLFSRIMAISLLVIAFAQPVIKDDSTSASLGTDVLIYLDNSLSLSAQGDNGASNFDEIVNDGSSIADSYPEGASFHFVENAYGNSLTTGFTRESLKELLTEVEQVGVDRDAQELYSRIKGSDFVGDVYLLSDFQGKSDFTSIRKDSVNQYFVKLIQSESLDNVFVDSVFLENSYLSGKFSNLLNVTLRRNYRDNEEVNIKLLIDGQLYGTGEVDFGNQLVANHVFELQGALPGLERIELQIEDPTLQFDNSFYLSINKVDRVRVIEVYDENSPSFLSALFEDNEAFQFDRIDSRFVDNELLSSANFLLINQIQKPSNQLISSVNGLLESGGTVVVIPSAESGEGELSRLGIRANAESQERVKLSSPDFENPLYQGVFEDEDENIEMPEATVSFRVLNSELDYLQFVNGRSYLSKVISDGNLFFFASPFDIKYSSFPSHALFVPVMYKLALGSKVNLSNLYYYTDSETVFFPIDEVNPGSIFQMSSEAGQLTPDQRIDGDRLVLEIPKDLIRAGHYSLMQGSESVGTLSFNIPKSESDLSPLDPAIFSELAELNHVTVMGLEGDGDVKRFLEAKIIGKSLWKYALLGALFFLFVEIILIRYL
ncbi:MULTISPECIES: BatA domain-containing protein [Roseivirga]|nr:MULTISPECIES: BatA domain-containing protein [Roseivirga]MBO6662100.1 BatA domain-containing protein [Roseivirga sp.]MBO6910418.1 BatA domain-containing protein [Roseivirga sp.]WPZ12308.1 BatA domain-containing protein [Roseivirga spongicola]